MPTVTIKRTAARNTLTDTAGVTHDLSRYFTERRAPAAPVISARDAAT
jgi:hypothetical protein